MAIKHLSWYSMKEIKNRPDIPIWKRREILLSPFVLLVGAGYAVYGISVFAFWIIKWCIFSWIAPFIYWKGMCKIGFHKYRRDDDRGNDYTCNICGDKKEITMPI